MSYDATILVSAERLPLAKVYARPDEAPLQYSRGLEFFARPLTCDDFWDFIYALATLDAIEALIPGAIRPEALPHITSGGAVQRLAYPQGDTKPAFCEAERRWLILDLDHTDVEVDWSDYEGSVQRWRATLPPWARNAASAWFPSASAHRSTTVRGKLVVSLDSPVSHARASRLAKECGCDGSVCHTVSLNYLAAPVFLEGEDPIAEYRAPLLFDGPDATPPASEEDLLASSDTHLGERDGSAHASVYSSRACTLARIVTDRWTEGDRIVSHAWLHLCGWCLGCGWQRGELEALCELLDEREPDKSKAWEHVRIMRNARAIGGPGGARDWLRDLYPYARAVVEYDAVVEGALEGRSAILAPSQDPWEHPWVWTNDIDPGPDYYCSGLKLAPCKGKISLIAGLPGGAKGPIIAHLAVCFALGLEAFGQFPCQKKRVLMLDFEGASLTSTRIKRMARGLGANPEDLEGRIDLLDASSLNLTEPEQAQKLRQYVEARGIEVVFVDTYTSAMLHSGIEAASPHYAVLARILGQLDVLVIALAHLPKSASHAEISSITDIAHSGALAAMSQTAVIVRYPDLTNKDVVQLTVVRSPATCPPPFELRFLGAESDPALRLEVYIRPEGIEADIPSGLKRAAAEEALVQSHAKGVLSLLESADPMRSGIPEGKIRATLAIPGGLWGRVRGEVLKQGVSEASLPCDRDVKMVLPGVAAPKKPVIPRPRGLSP